jgi:peptidoglycan/LPS O-acetylase OafA/YrhL
MHNPSFRLSYMPSFDGMRGLAILLVVGHHSGTPFFQGGFVGVDVFFTLSGFLITALLIKEFDANGRINFKYFYVRRALRLLPALIVMLIAFDVYALFALPADIARSFFEDSLLSLAYLTNWAYASGRTYLFFAHTWSLAIEEQFYLLFPALLTCLLSRLSRRGVIMAVVALAVASCLWGLVLLATNVFWARVYAGLDTRLWELLIGCIIALVLSSDPLLDHLKSFIAGARLWAHMLAAGACVTLVTLTVAVSSSDPATSYLALSLSTLSTGILILYVVTVDQSLFKRAVEWRSLVFIGKISYGLYLWHAMIYSILGRGSPLHLMASTVLTLLISVVSYRWVEMPMLRLKSRFQSRSTPGNLQNTGV